MRAGARCVASRQGLRTKPKRALNFVRLMRANSDLIQPATPREAWTYRRFTPVVLSCFEAELVVAGGYRYRLRPEILLQLGRAAQSVLPGLLDASGP